jgi:hypothetical protein
VPVARIRPKYEDVRLVNTIFSVDSQIFNSSRLYSAEAHCTPSFDEIAARFPALPDCLPCLQSGLSNEEKMAASFFSGVAFGAALTASGVYHPLSIMRQFQLADFHMLEVFLGATASST